MTREQLLRTSIELQLHAVTNWTVLDEPLALRTAPSDLPGFHLSLGAAIYDTYNASQQPLTGHQSVTVRIYFAHPMNALDVTFLERSALVNFIEEFFRGTYTAPAPVLGDTAQIDYVRIDSIEPESETRTQTRSIITVRATCAFTLL